MHLWWAKKIRNRPLRRAALIAVYPVALVVLTVIVLRSGVVETTRYYAKMWRFK